MAEVHQLMKRLKYTPEQCRAVPWFNIGGDKNRRIDYALNPSSVVYDVGGYVGDWAADIYSKYKCNIEIFEPVQEFADKIERRFAGKAKIHVHVVGLADKNHKVIIAYDGASSSTHKSSKDGEKIQLIKAADFIKGRHKKIDLMKINIEGDEYQLLEHLIKSGYIKKIDNVQVQFHDFVPNAKNRRAKIRKELSRTHHLTYSYPWIWENWRLRDE